METKIKYLGIVVLIFLSINVASADITGWHERVEVTDLDTGGMFLNDTGLGISRVFLLEIQSGEVTDINVDTDTYTVEIDISEPDYKTTTMTINTTNYTGVMVSTTHSFYHLKVGTLTSPIYILIGQPPLEWGVHSQGVVAKTYREIDLVANPLVDMPAFFALGWDVYDDRFLEPPMGFHITSDGPITIRYEIQPMEEIYERRDRSIAEYGLSLLAKIPYVGPPLALSIESIGTIMKVFISVVFFAITGWAILFLLFETFVLAHAIAVMKLAGGGVAGVVGVFGVIATDNYAMIMFVINAFTRMFTLLIDLVKAIRDMSPI